MKNKKPRTSWTSFRASPYEKFFIANQNHRQKIENKTQSKKRNKKLQKWNLFEDIISNTEVVSEGDPIIDIEFLSTGGDVDSSRRRPHRRSDLFYPLPSSYFRQNNIYPDWNLNV